MESNIVEDSASLLEDVLVDIDLDCEPLTAAGPKPYMSSIALGDDTFLGRHDGSERGVKFHLRILEHPSYLSRLEIRPKIRLRDNARPDLTLSIFLTPDNTSTISVKKITETDLAHRPGLNSIDRRENKVLEHVRSGRLWSISVAYDPGVDAANLSATGLYGGSTPGGLETEFNTLRTIFENPGTVELIAQGHALDRAMADLMALFEAERESPPLDAWYPKHPTKHFIQCGMYPEKENRPMVGISAQESFASFGEYTTVLGFGFIQEHEYQVRALEAVSGTTVRLQLIDMPGGGGRFMMGFVTFPETLVVRLQPNDRIVINFDLGELSSAPHWHARVLPPVAFAPRGAVSVIVTRPWIRPMDDDGNPTGAAHWADDPVPTFATGCDDHDFRPVKGGVVVIEDDGPFDDARSNVEAQGNLETPGDTVSVEDPELPVPDDSSTAPPDMQELFTPLDHTALTNLGDPIPTPQMITDHVDRVERAAEADLNPKDATAAADLAQYAPADLEETFPSMESDAPAPGLSDGMQVRTTWEVNPDFRPLPLERIATYGNMRELAVAVKSEAPAMIVRARIVLSNVPFRRSLASLRELSQPSDTDVGAVEQTRKIPIYKILLGSHLNGTHMAPVDLYGTLQDPNTAIFQHVKPYSLNAEQIMAIRYARAARGGVAVIQGPPGTGKTFFQMVSAMPLIANLCHEPGSDRAPCRHQLMMTAQTNDMVNQAAERLDNMIRSHSGVFSAPPLVIRVHATHTDRKIFMKDSVDRRGKPFDARPALYDESTVNDDLLEIVSVRTLLTLYRTATRTPFDMGDPRLRLYDMSLGMAMLKVCGLVDSPYAGSESAYAELKNDLLYFEDGHLMSPDENEAMTNRINQLRADTLRRADVVLCTLAAAGDPALYSYFSPHVIYVDEANKAAENETWNVVARYNPRAIVLIGDQDQLKPTVMSPWKDNGFRDQLTKSLFSRLIANGHNYVMLRVQHRMHPQISYPVNETFYKGRLRDAANVAEREAMSARLLEISDAVETLNGVFFNLQGRHNVLIDVADGRTLVNAAMSRRNVPNLSTGVRLVMDLLTSTRLPSPNPITADDIVVLTPYQAQYEDYVRAFEQLHENHPETGYNKIRSRKVDGFQGGEAPIVIVDLTITDHAGFLRERNRLNVAISRAQVAQYVLLSASMFHESTKEKGNTRKSLLDVTQHFKEKGWIVKQRSHPPLPESVAALLATTVEDATKNEIANDRFTSVGKQTIGTGDDATEEVQDSSMTAQDTWGDAPTVAAQEPWMSTENAWGGAGWTNSEAHGADDDGTGGGQEHENTQEW